MGDLVLDIGGVRAALATCDPVLPGVVRDRYAAFLGDGVGDWRLTATVVAAAAAPGRQVHVHATGARRFHLERYDFRGSLDLERRQGEVELADTDALTFDSFLRVTLSLALGEADGLLVHAASLARDGRGYLFPGVSGAGKTTVARLSSDATLLSDELSIVTACARAPRLHGTPFWGELARGGENRAVPLAGVYFLRQGPSHRLRPLGEAEALRRLLATVMFFPRDPATVAGVFDRAAALVAAAPCFELEFRPDPGFWEVIRGV